MLLKVTAYSHLAADSQKKLKSKNTLQNVQVENSLHLPIFSTFQSLIILESSTLSFQLFLAHINRLERQRSYLAISFDIGYSILKQSDMSEQFSILTWVAQRPVGLP